MRIRAFSVSDTEAVLSLWERSEILRPWLDLRAEIVEKMKRDRSLFLVAEDAGVVVGAVMGAYDGRRGWVYHLAVEPDRRHAGIGRQLMHELEDRMVKMGVVKVNLQVRTTISASLSSTRRSITATSGLLAWASACVWLTRSLRRGTPSTRTPPPAHGRLADSKKLLQLAEGKLQSLLACYRDREQPPATRMFAVVHHRGHRSGRMYSTPVTSIPRGGWFWFGLTFGTESGWARNVLANGECVLRYPGSDYHLVEPSVLDYAAIRSELPLVMRLAVPLTGVPKALRLRNAGKD